MEDKEALSTEDLICECKPSDFDFDSTDEIEPFSNGIIGQNRAVDAVDLGLKVEQKGYNIYMAGDTGTGKSTYAKNIRIKTVTGDVVIYSQNYADDIEIESSSADVTIYNLDFDKYKVEVHTGSGNIKTPYGNFDKDFSRGNSERLIYIKTSSGDVEFK